MVAERGQQLGAALEMAAMRTELSQRALARAPAEGAHALLAPRDTLGNRLRAETAGDALQPGTTGGNAARQRRIGPPAQAVEPVARAGKPRLQQAHGQPRCAAGEPRTVRARIGEQRPTETPLHGIETLTRQRQ